MSVRPHHPYRVAIVMPPGGVPALKWLIDGRITTDGRVVEVTGYRGLDAFRQGGPCDAIVLFENYYDELQRSDAGDALVAIVRKTRHTIRRDSFPFAGRELPMAQVPDDLLSILPIDIYQKGPFHRRLVIIAGIVLVVSAALLLYFA